jgi:hypothetical protein
MIHYNYDQSHYLGRWDDETFRKTVRRIRNAHFYHPERFRGLKPRIGKQKRQQTWYLPCCKYAVYFSAESP